jgi:hypothetical protein
VEEVKALHLGLSLSSVVLVALGCGTVKDNPPADPDGGVVVGADAPIVDSGASGSFTLSVTPTTLSIPIAGSAMATLSVDRTGPPGDIMLSAGSLPAGITVAFAANPIPAGTASTTATIAIAPGTAAGVSNVTITGTGGGAERSVTIAVTATTITVTGKVRGDRAGVQVRIPGKPLVTTGADGSFSFTDVSPPYDLYTLGSSGAIFGTAIPTVFYFQGLTRPDPIVTAPSQFGLIGILRRNTNTMSGTTAVAPATMLVAWETGGSMRVNQTGAYSFVASWTGGATITSTLYGFQFATDAVTGAPSGFTGYASLGVADIAASGTSTANLVMQAPATATLTGAITSPSGFPNPDITLTQQLGASGSVPLWQTTTPTTNAHAVIPLVGAGKAALFATATLGGANTRFVHPALAATTDVTFALPSPAVPSAPLDTAMGITAATDFTWSATPDAIYEVIAGTPSDAPVPAAFQLYTTSATGKIPVVPELALPLNQSFSWHVNAYGPNASIDAVASTAGLEFVSQADFDGALHWTTTGISRAFTSAP